MSGEENNMQAKFPTIGLKLTGACQLNCGFCCEPDRNQEIYPVKNFKKIITILKDNFGIKRICFTGGDPILYPDIDNILNFTKNSGIYVLLLTSNGRLLIDNKHLIFPHVDAIRFSIHGIDAKHDEAVKRIGAFTEISNAMSETAKAGIQLMATTVVTKRNINQLKDIAKLIFKMGASHFYLFGLMKSGNGDEYIKIHGDPSFEDIDLIRNELAVEYKDKMEIIFYDYKNKAECILVYGDGRIVIDPCPSGENFQQKIGNIFLDDQEKILFNFNKDPDNSIGYSKHF
jgi:MoaA/NifB/PqqE/SkfB family radical SAM enzyme